MIGRIKPHILKVTGLALIVIGAIILFSVTSTDISAYFNQRKLAAQWKKMADKRPEIKQKRTDIMPKSPIPTPSLLLEPTTTQTSLTPKKMSRKRQEGRTTSTTAAAQLLNDLTPLILRPHPNNQQDMDEQDSEDAVIARPATLQYTGWRGRIPHKSPFARIVIPKIDLDAIVVEGVDKEALALGPGHMEETPWPGEIGNMVISGHRVTYSHPFYYVDELKPGDPIHIYALDGKKFTYYMAKQKVVQPNDVSVLEPTDDKTLTLTTCNPRFSARTRLVVIAKMPLGLEDLGIVTED